MPKRPQIGMGVLITKDDRVLLIKRENTHGDAPWSTPGEHLKYGEMLEECAIRETLEETGVIIADVTFLAITNNVFGARKEHTLTIWMAGRYVSGTPATKPGQDISAIDWFSWDALPEPLSLSFEHLLTGRCYPALWDFSGGDGARIPTT